MKRVFLILLTTVVLLSLHGCGETSDDIVIHYSGDTMSIEYDGNEIEYDLGNSSSESVPPDYDPAMVIDLFEDVDDWLIYSGTDTNASVDLNIPENYEKECNGYYFVRHSGRYSTKVMNVIRNNELIGSIVFALKNSTGLSMNEAFTVSCTMTDISAGTLDIPDIFAQTGHIILETSRDIVFSGSGISDITSADQITQEHLDSAGDYIYDYATQEYLGQSGMFSDDEFFYYNIDKVYFASLKPTSILSYKGKSMLTFIITNKGKTYTVDLYELSLDANNTFSFTGNSTYKGELFDKNFNYTELNVDMERN